MAAVTPIISFTAIPGVAATMAGALTYDEFVFMLGINNLQMRKIFMEASRNQQINGSYGWTSFDSNGIQNDFVLKPKISPYNYQPSVYLDMPGHNFILNGLSYINLNLLAGETLSMFLGSEQASPQDLVDNFHQNFKEYPDMMGNLDRFDQMREYL